MTSVSLVLGSGGARGYAHIGVIRALEERGYTVQGVSGCSMGALVGGFYAADKLDELEAWSRSLTYLDVIRMVDLSLLSSGAIRGDKVFSRVKEILGDIQIEDLRIPYTAVATDITHQKEVWFQSGPLESAIRASVAIPSLITPVVSGNRVLVDGGVLNPLPIAPSVSVHADRIIAVDLSADVPLPSQPETNSEELESEGQEKSSWLMQLKDVAFSWLEDKETVDTESAMNANLSKLSVMYQMFDTMQASLTHYKVAGYRPDLLIKIPKDSIKLYEFYRADRQIQLGYDIAVDALSAYEQNRGSVYGQI